MTLLAECAVQTFPEVLIVLYFAFQERRRQTEDVVAFTAEVAAQEVFLVAKCAA